MAYVGTTEALLKQNIHCTLYTQEGSENFFWEEDPWLHPPHKESVNCDDPLLTRPWGIQPVLDVQDLLVFGSGKCFLTDLIVLGDFLLEE